MLNTLCSQGIVAARRLLSRQAQVSSFLPSGSSRLTSLPHAASFSVHRHNTRIQLSTQHINMPPLTAMDVAADLVDSVHQLKIDRDTWQALALQYKAAFEVQTARLRELQDICFATQAELENERVQYRRLHMGLDGAQHDHPLTVDSSDDFGSIQPFGTAIVLSPSRIDMSWRLRPSEECGNPIFKRVQQFASQRNYGTALVEIERLLRGPLSSKARAEGLLLKSSILQATGPDSLYDALAACSEALELCDRMSELQYLLPKIQYQRGLYYYQLRMLQQAREAFRAVSEDKLLFERANEYRQSCDDELELLHFDRRSVFDETRCMTGSLLAQLNVGSSHVSVHCIVGSATTDSLQGRLRQTSAQLKLRATQKAKRMSLPHRWVSSKSDMSSKTDEV